MVEFAGDKANALVNPATRLLGNNLDNDWMSAARRVGGGPSEPDLIAGPLGEWRLDKNRPFSGIGRFPISFTPNQQFAAGGFSPYAPAAEKQPQVGFFENFLGGIFGLLPVVGEPASQVGHAIGKYALDTPISAVAEAINLPFGLITSIPTLTREGGLDPEIQRQYEDSIKENPLNALFMLDQVARKQWEKDVLSGRTSGLLQAIGPSTNIWETLGAGLSILDLSRAVTQRQLLEGGVAGKEQLTAVERAARTGDPLASSFYNALAQRYASGAFGPVGSREARDKVMDEIAVHNMIRRGADEPDEGLLSGQTFADLLVGLFTDPLIIGNAITAIGSKVAITGARAATAKVLEAIPEGALRSKALAESVSYLARTRNLDEQAAARLLASDEPARIAAFNEVTKAAEFEPYREGVQAGLTYLQKWGQTWEPAMRPITRAISKINNPAEWFSKGPAGKLAGDVMDRWATEGAVRSVGLDNYMGVLNSLKGEGADDIAAIAQNGFGVSAAFGVRVWGRRQLAQQVRWVNGLPAGLSPDEIITAQHAGLTGKDVASKVELEMLRHQKRYLAAGRGGQAAALQGARDEAAQRLTLMGMDPQAAIRATADWNVKQAAFMDWAYFGHISQNWKQALDQVLASNPKVKKGALDLTTLTPLGPRTMTVDKAKEVLAAAKAKDIATVRQAVGDWDLLFDNLHQGADADELLRNTITLLEDQLKNKTIPRELDQALNLPAELDAWRTTNAPLGYRLGYKPEDLWRATVDADGKIVGINPWIDIVADATAPVEFSKFQVARDRLFHDIRGERIIAEARVNFARHAAEEVGMNGTEADALFARFIATARDMQITPRGLNAQTIYKVVKTHGLPDEMLEKIDPQKAIELLNKGFEGNFWQVGWSQKFTGKLKTGLGGASNWLGVMAEHIYPLVRFLYSPVFQAQELLEGPILNTMRGIKPGWTLSDMDKATLNLLDVVVHQSKYALDDQAERGASFLIGFDAVRDAFQPSTRMGKMTRAVWFGNKINVKGIKEINFLRFARQQIGLDFQKAMARVQPDLVPSLIAHYGTGDLGEVAVRYMTEKANWSQGTRSYVDGILDATKSSAFGARTEVTLARVAALLDDFDTADEVRIAIQEGRLTRSQFTDAMRKVGGDEDFADRAWVVAAAVRTAEQFWDDALTVAPGGVREVAANRAIWQSVAKGMDISEEEFIARRLAGIGSVDAADIARLTGPEWDDAVRLQTARESLLGQYHLQKTYDDFATMTFNADREFHVVIDGQTGQILGLPDQADGPWQQTATSVFAGPGLGVDVSPQNVEFLGAGRITLHNHPDLTMPSHADIINSIASDADVGRVQGPGGWFEFVKPEDGWLSSPRLVDVAGNERNPARLSNDQGRELSDRVAESWQRHSTEVLGYLRDYQWYGSEARRAAGIDYMATPAYNFRASVLIGQAVADEFGFGFRAARDLLLPPDLAAVERSMKEAADNPSFMLLRYNRAEAMSEEVLRVDPIKGNVFSEHVVLPSQFRAIQSFIQGSTLPVEVRTEATALVERWMATNVANTTGVLIDRGVHVGTGWTNYADLAQTAYHMIGTPGDTWASGLALAHMTRAPRLMEYRVLRPLGAEELSADAYAAGQRWSLAIESNLVPSTSEGRANFKGAVEDHFSLELGQGRWDVVFDTDAKGQSVLRMISHEHPTGMTADDFKHFVFYDPSDPNLMDNLFARMGWDTDPDAIISLNVDSVSVRELEQAADGQGYLEELRRRGATDLADLVERRLDGQVNQEFASALHGLAPESFREHLAALRAGGADIPDFGTPRGQPATYAVEQPNPLFLPGGAERTTRYTIQEQTIIEAQMLDPGPLWESSPDLMVRMYDNAFASKTKSLAQIDDMYNAMLFGRMARSLPLHDAEAAFNRMRAIRQPGTPGTMQELADTAQFIVGSASDPTDTRMMGNIFALHEGYYSLPRQAEWLTPTQIEQMVDAAEVEQSLIHADVLTGTLLDDAVQRANQRLQQAQSPLGVVDFGEAGLGLGPVAVLKRPEMAWMSDDVIGAWGDALRWQDDQVFASIPLNSFLHRLPDESRRDWALRTASMLQGVDGRAAMQAVQSAGPHLVGEPVLTESIVMDIIESAKRNGDWPVLRDALSAQYATEVAGAYRLDVLNEVAGARWPIPSVEGIRLAPNARRRMLDPNEVHIGLHGEMRETLQRFVTNPDTLSLYSPDVLDQIAKASDGVIYRWGGDYKVLSDYYASMQAKRGGALANMSASEYSWIENDRLSARMHLLPTQSEGMKPIPNFGAADTMSARQLMADGRPTQPRHIVRLQQRSGKIMGATLLTEDQRAIVLATQYADVTTMLHEITHVWEDMIDPSLRTQLLDAFNVGRDTPKTAWDREVSEWFADGFQDYIRAKGKVRGPAQPGFEYFAKWLKRVHDGLVQESESVLLAAQKVSRLAELSVQFAEVHKTVREATQALGRTQRTRDKALQAVRGAKHRTGMDVLEARATEARTAYDRLFEARKQATADRMAAEHALREAQAKALVAKGSTKAGGATTAVRTRVRQAEAARLREVTLKKNVVEAHKHRTRANEALRGAQRRTPVADLEATLDKAQVEHTTAVGVWKEANAAEGKVVKVRDQVKRAPVRSAGTAPKPVINPGLREFFDEVLTHRPVKASGGSPVDLGQHYDIKAEATAAAGRMAISKGEDRGFTLHYYKRGRSFVERSINHPYFGLYPASYMWGKILPEMVRFLVKEPFGVPAPLGGLQLSNAIYRNIMLKQNFDEDFRRDMANSDKFWQALSMLAPAMPWEIPVNAPLWARRTAEAEAIRQVKLAEGATPDEAPLFQPEQLGKAAYDMMQYAFGPAYLAQILGGAAGALQDVGDSTFGTAVTTVNGILSNVAGGNPDTENPQFQTGFGTP